MKVIIIAAIAVTALAHQTFGQGAQGAQITQRARELVKENNVRQGIQQPSPTAPQPAAQPQKAAAQNPAQVQQQDINKIKNDIAAIRASAQIAPDKIKKLAADLLTAARGAKKPSPAALDKLAASLGNQVAGSTLESAQELRLAQDLVGIVNGAKLSQLQADAYVSDVQAILQVAGAKRNEALSAAADAKALMAEIRR